MWNRSNGYVTAIFLIILLLTIGNYIFFSTNLSLIKANENWITHTLLVKTALDNTLQKITDAETEERGYLITGDSIYLNQYKKALPDLQKDIGTVKSLTEDNPAQQKR